MESISYDRPREKLQLKGAAALTSVELLQVLIGSGNAQVSVGRIAKRSLQLLTRFGTDLTYEQLLEVVGLGPARACQIIAAFELASRYPINQRQLVIDSHDKVLGLFSEIRAASHEYLTYVTVDGGKRLIAKRKISITQATHPSALLRKIFADVVTDSAAGLIVGLGRSQRPLDPSMFDLSLARDLRAMSQLFMVTVYEHLLINKAAHISLRSESW